MNPYLGSHNPFDTSLAQDGTAHPHVDVLHPLSSLLEKDRFPLNVAHAHDQLDHHHSHDNMEKFVQTTDHLHRHYATDMSPWSGNHFGSPMLPQMTPFPSMYKTDMSALLHMPTDTNILNHLDNATDSEDDDDDEDRLRLKKRKAITSLSGLDASSRKFPCDFSGCGKSFKRSGHLKRHKLVHMPQTERSRFYCKEPGCSKNYSTKYDLTAHMRQVHEGVKLWKCSVRGCCRRFVKKDSLDKHLDEFSHDKALMRDDGFDSDESNSDEPHHTHLPHSPNTTIPLLPEANYVNMMHSTTPITPLHSLLPQPTSSHLPLSSLLHTPTVGLSSHLSNTPFSIMNLTNNSPPPINLLHPAILPEDLKSNSQADI